jgi:hypothetical protein
MKDTVQYSSPFLSITHAGGPFSSGELRLQQKQGVGEMLECLTSAIGPSFGGKTSVAKTQRAVKEV